MINTTRPPSRPRTLTKIIAAGMLVLGLIATGACSGAATSAAESPTCPGGKIRFGVEPFEDPAKLVPAYQVLAGALGEKLNCPVELQVVQDYSAEVLAMQNGNLELAQFGPLGYVFASQRANAEPIASFADASGTLSTYTAGIWVPKDSAITDVAGLAGHSLALSDPGSTSGDALPRQALTEAGVIDQVKVDYAGGHPEALLALINGKVDAAEINSQQLATATKEGTFDQQAYRRIWTSAEIPNDPITVAGDLDPAFKDAVRTALLELPTDKVAEVGAFLDVEPGPMVEVTEETYRPLFELAETLGLTEADV
ncbi:phosphate/phosphite/phosphonate ABC transporter substrate-binding protein [Microlunatus parietis]|uniref:Phosphonate transport system substrate-binding protein n=1 Tax=Microlunatus parietis TaxID=682979 RepID=A0A7Y9LFT5_9ACTN|nr:phosphate/phosphite/phosphonate ABC transporter substrate-binding protein [Microlunatus parietis]NYE74446.1 phosphonate transport system substrate-binding protein [Microlunatus parietis]